MEEVSLRKVSQSDFDLVMKWENNPEFWPFAASEGPFSAQEVVNFIDECNDLDRHGQCRWIILSDPSNAVGSMDLFEFDPVQKTAGIGILIAEPADRKKGYASKAIAALFANEELKKKIRLVWCLVHEDNEPSLRLFEACGFAKQGIRLYRGKKAVRFTRYL